MPFQIVARTDDTEARSFYIHIDLAVPESKRIEGSLSGGFKENREGKIELDEDPALLVHFFEYLYQHGRAQYNPVEFEADYILLARLYAMGDRLQADKFQGHVLRCFLSKFDSHTRLSDGIICDLLEIASDELPDRVDADPLKDHVYWYVAARMDKLRKFPRFGEILCLRAPLGKDLCLRAGNSTMSQPHKPSDPLPTRFKIESYRSESV